MIRSTSRWLRGASIAASFVAAFGSAAPLAAQVGFEPAESPFRDVVYRSAFTGFAGWLATASDVAGVAPQSGPMLGIRWDARIGGPVDFMARLATVRSERTVIDPVRPLDDRDRGTVSVPLTLMDVGIGLNLTGQKSWRTLVPVVNLGLGVVTDFEPEDVGGFKLGTNLAVSAGAGVRWIPGTGRLSFRADIADHLYRIRYPGLYYGDASIPAGIPPVLDATEARSRWTNNFSITLGGAYQLWR